MTPLSDVFRLVARGPLKFSYVHQINLEIGRKADGPQWNETSYLALRNGFFCLSLALAIFAVAVLTQRAALTLSPKPYISCIPD